MTKEEIGKLGVEKGSWNSRRRIKAERWTEREMYISRETACYTSLIGTNETRDYFTPVYDGIDVD